MMKKAKTIFIISFVVLLVTMSSGIVSLYKSIQDNGYIDNHPNDYELENMTNHLEMLILKISKEVNPDYQLYQFQSDNEKEKELVENKWQENLNAIEEAIYNDSYFGFSIQNTQTSEKKSNHEELLDDEHILYEHITFDENGKISLHEGNLNYWFNESLLYNIFDDDPLWDENSNVSVGLERIKINTPKNLDITFVVSQKLNSGQDVIGIISNTYYQPTRFIAFIMIALSICFVVSALFILFYPIRIVEKVNPFLTIKEWKAEVLIILFSGFTALAMTGCVMISEMTLSGQIGTVLSRFLKDSYHIVENILNFGIWFIILFIMVCICFLIKYVFVYGLWNYIKEKTLISSICRYLKNTFLKITDIDLSNSINQAILHYILVNTAVIIILIALNGFGVILAIIYAFVSFFFIQKEIGQIYDDYQKLLRLTHELGQGHFDQEINEDVGVFNSLKNEFHTIKNGFEKAVKEETKSQNMKTELISNVSHDLKTPITCIKNYVYLLKDENLNQEQRNQYIQSLEQYTNCLTSLIEDLFEVSKVNSGNIQLNLMNLNIIALLEQSIAESEEILNSKGLTVIKNYHNTDIQLYLDGDKTYRVFENLLTNVGKYALANSRFYIDVEETTDTVILEFKNISEDQMNFTADEIVERFVRGDKSRHETGSGLGLAIAKSFIEAQGGQFQIDIDGDLFKIIIIFDK